tara:strand:- start:2737 stop:3057 length:321 start_codon:yes stop_codon:yes gene_type:complete
MATYSTLTIFGSDFDKNSDEHKNVKILIRMEGQEEEGRIEALNLARELNCSTMIETRRKKAKEDGDMGRFYIKGKGLTAEEAANILRTQPRSTETKNYYQPLARIV